MHDFDGTNPLLEALGDEPEIKEITLINSSAFIIVEPLTQVRLQPLEKTVIRVKGNAAYEQITANIKQLNALKSDVISIETSEPEDGLDSLPWLSSQDQAVFLSMQLEGGVAFATVGGKVLISYTNANQHDVRAQLGFQIDGQWTVEQMRVSAGGGIFEYTVPQRYDYPEGENSFALVIGGEDILETGFHLLDLRIYAESPHPWDLTNCTVTNGLLTYTGGLIEKEGRFPIQLIPSLFASKNFKAGEELLIAVPPSSCNKLLIVFDMGTRFGDWSDGSAVVQERPDINSIQLFNGRSAPAGNIDTTLLSGEYLISMKLQSNMVALLTVKDAGNNQELASLAVDAAQSGYEAGFTRLWIYAELESSESPFSIQVIEPLDSSSALNDGFSPS